MRLGDKCRVSIALSYVPIYLMNGYGASTIGAYLWLSNLIDYHGLASLVYGYLGCPISSKWTSMCVSV